jgi:hypothetical protein
MVYSFRGAQYDIPVPEAVLLAVLDTGIATTEEEREDAQQIVDAFDAETEALLPHIHCWNNS